MICIIWSGDHGPCDCDVKSPPGPPGPPGDAGDFGMEGEWGQQGDQGEPGTRGVGGVPVSRHTPCLKKISPNICHCLLTLKLFKTVMILLVCW